MKIFYPEWNLSLHRSKITFSLDSQFEPERFVNGLLGIGAAGGASSKSDGAMLAARLETMRKERDERSKVMKTPVAAGSGTDFLANVESPNPGSMPDRRSAAARPGRQKNKKKKKKGGK